MIVARRHQKNRSVPTDHRVLVKQMTKHFKIDITPAYLVRSQSSEPLSIIRHERNQHFFYLSGSKKNHFYKLAYQGSNIIHDILELPCYQPVDDDVNCNRLALFDTMGNFYDNLALQAMKSHIHMNSYTMKKHTAIFKCPDDKEVQLKVDDIYCLSGAASDEST